MPKYNVPVVVIRKELYVYQVEAKNGYDATAKAVVLHDELAAEPYHQTVLVDSREWGKPTVAGSGDRYVQGSEDDEDRKGHDDADDDPAKSAHGEQSSLLADG